MSSVGSTPEHLALYDKNFINDKDFSEDINRKMRLPKRIRIGSDHMTDEPIMNGFSDPLMNNLSKKPIDMQVPERIIVVGHDQHIGTKTLPREMILENQELPPDPSTIRVTTPPRVITLDRYHFPSVKDPLPDNEDDEEEKQLPPPAVKPRTRLMLNDNKNLDFYNRESTPGLNSSMISRSGGADDTLTSGDEVLHLRKQLARFNRRLMALEMDNAQRQQREKIIYGFGLAYLILKTIFWLNRS